MTNTKALYNRNNRKGGPPLEHMNKYELCVQSLSGLEELFVADYGWRRFAQNVAAAPDGFDEILALGSRCKFLAQLADKHVDDFQFRLIHAAIQVVEEHFLGERCAFAE